MLSTALAAVLALGIAAQPARAQSVTSTGLVNPNDANGQAVWDVDGTLYVGLAGVGTLTVKDGGTVVNSAPNAPAYIGFGAGGHGTVTVSGADADGHVSTWTNPGLISVGHNQQGDLFVDSGGKIFSASGVLGNTGSGVGTATLSGQGSAWTMTGALTIGNSGRGTLDIKDGATVSSDYGVLGSQATSTANVSVSGAGSAWTVTGELQVSNRGKATLTIDHDGLVAADYVRLAVTASNSGTLYLNGDAVGGRGVLETGYVQKVASTGTLDLNGGILRASRDEGNFLRSFGPVSPGTEGAWIDSNGHDITINSGTTFAGPNTLNKIGLGTLTLTGDSSGFTGTTTVSGGALIVGTAAGGALGGAINVGDGGLLGGTGTIGTAGSATTILAGGVHAPGNSIGVQNVAGDYVNNGTLRIEVTPTAADRVAVAGAVDISGATLDLLISPANAANWGIFNNPFIIIDNQGAGAVVGTFSSVTKNLLFFDANVAYDGGDGNDVTLSVARNSTTYASVGQTRNQIATGAAIESLGSTNPLWLLVALTGDPDTARKSFDALSGEIHASAKTALIEDSRFVRNAINDRIRASFAAPGASNAPALAYASADAPVAVAPDHAGPVFWAHGFGSWGQTGSDGNAASMKRSTGGLLFGTDGPVGDWRLGFMAGYSYTSFNMRDRASSGTSDNYHFGAYGGTTWGNLALRTGLAYTRHQLDTRRSVAIPGFSDNPSARYDAGTAQVFGELAYGISAGSLAFEPFANLAYVNLDTDGFTEKGNAAALTSGSANTDAALTTLGLRASTRLALGEMAATLKGMAGWRHAFGDVTPNAAMRFASGGDTFTIGGVPIARDAAVIEAGLDVALSPVATLGVSYGGQFGSGVTDQSVRANFNMTF
jgi:outer membrane autotransporter protein